MRFVCRGTRLSLLEAPRHAAGAAFAAALAGHSALQARLQADAGAEAAEGVAFGRFLGLEIDVFVAEIRRLKRSLAGF